MLRIGGRAWVTCAVAATALVQVALVSHPGQAVRVTTTLTLAAVSWAAVEIARAARRTRGPARGVWVVGTVALGLWALSLLWYAEDEVLHNRFAAHPSPGDAMTVAAFVAAVAVMLMTAGAPPGRPARLRMALDGILLATALFGVAWLVLLHQVIDRPAAEFGGPLIAYPIAAVVVLSMALTLFAGSRRLDGAQALIRAGVAAIATGVFAAVATSMMDIGLIRAGGAGLVLLGALLLGAAARHPLPERGERTWDPSTPLGRALPYLTIAVILIGALVVRLSTGAFDPVLAWTAYALVAVVLARQGLTVWINTELTRELERQRRHLAHQARHDPLTGLSNRIVLGERLTAAVARAATDGGPEPALLLVDLDGFKAINDSLGHAAGDELLVAVGQRLRACAGPRDTAARLGGDEFAMLLDAVAGPAEVSAFAERLLERLAVPMPLTGGESTVRASIGGAVADPGDRADAERLLRDADVALYAAKADGRGRFRLADEHLRARARDQMVLDGELRGALARDELEVHYQPIVELATGRVTGAEALLRWRHPVRGLLPPGTFLPSAEAAGLMPDLDRWVMLQACRQAARWRRTAPDFSVSVNISAGHLTTTTLVRDVTRALDDAGLPPEALALELTETALVTDTTAAAALLAELAELGVRVALDDFGTGYSSLAYLRSLPIHTIKIDRSFVSGLGDGAANDAVTRAVLDLAGTLGLHQVAEGVETADQAARLRGLRCTYGQGYHFSRPVPPELFLEILTAGPLPAGRQQRLAPAA